jgi:hypothetical protein
MELILLTVPGCPSAAAFEERLAAAGDHACRSRPKRATSCRQMCRRSQLNARAWAPRRMRHGCSATGSWVGARCVSGPDPGW